MLATAHPNAINQEIHVHKDLTLIFEHDIEDMVLISTTQMNTDCTWGTFDSFRLEPGTSVYCLVIGSKAGINRESGQKTPYYCALVLKSCASNDQLKERIGVLSLPKHLQVFEHALEHNLDLI